MTEPSRPRPVPGPPRPGAVGIPAGARVVVPVEAPVEVPAPSAASVEPAVGAAVDPAPDTAERPSARFTDLAQRPVGEHVAVFEAEHDRLQRELGTIDQL